MPSQACRKHHKRRCDGRPPPGNEPDGGVYKVIESRRFPLSTDRPMWQVAPVAILGPGAVFERIFT